MDGKVKILHPWLLAIFPGLSIVADHAQFLSLNSTVLLLMAGLLVTMAALCGFSHLLFRSINKASLFSSLFFFLFFSYGHFFDYLINTVEIPVQHRHLFLVWLLLFVLLFGLAWKVKDHWQQIHQALNGVGMILILLSAAQIGHYQLTKNNDWEPTQEPQGEQSSATRPITEPLPDIYYIILDAYGNANTLEEMYEFENSEFIEGLEKRGFFVIHNGRTNYALTTLSLSSSLNLSHVNDINQITGEESQAIDIPKRLIENNRVFDFLQARGYQTIFIGSGYGISQSNRQADVDIRCGRIDETIGRFIATSLLRAPADTLHLLENDDRRRRLCMFEALASLPGDAGPKFVLAHVPSPHWPFLFDAAGNPISLSNLTHDEQKRAYINQTIYLNLRVNEIIDEILKESEVEPIIILQSDHGPAFEHGWSSPSPAFYRERMRILNAYYLPQDGRSQLYDTITPVNSFRVIFNYYFETNLPLLEDRSYFSSYQYPYRFRDVTDSLETH